MIRAIINAFFFSSRRRHTRLVSDWSSDVCSSDLTIRRSPASAGVARIASPIGFLAINSYCGPAFTTNTRSEERRVGKSVDLGGWRIIKKKTKIISKKGDYNAYTRKY